MSVNGVSNKNSVGVTVLVPADLMKRVVDYAIDHNIILSAALTSIVKTFFEAVDFCESQGIDLPEVE